REIIRRGDDVACILAPGDELLELGDSIPSGPFARAFTRYTGALPSPYRLKLGRTGRVASRNAVELVIEPIDEDRFGYRLWADTETGLLLRSEMLDASGTRLETFQFVAAWDIRRTPSRLKSVNTLMYTDGLAAFSVFIEDMPESGASAQVSRRGATVAVAHPLELPQDRARLVTVVGEIPTRTAQRIAASVKPTDPR
ncbi:MAG: MucB/RseB C-terminal domain-containing protein, partial [Gammaproteobacteria bacterium]